MHGKIHLVPYDPYTPLLHQFLPKANPKAKSIPNIFAKAPAFSSEREMYKWILDTLNNSKLFPNHSFVATSYKADEPDPSRQAIDCGMYHRKLLPKNSENPEMTHNRRVNWSRLEMGIECKLHGTNQDPFDDRQDDGEPRAEDRKKALRQILSHAELVFKHQQRTFQFMVLFLGHYARVVHFDRSGVYSTTKFEYKSQGAALTRFLVRYSRLSSANRGFDTTAHRIEPDSELGLKMQKLGEEAAKADPSDHIQQLFNRSLDASWAWWKLEVHVERKESTQPSAPADIDIQEFVVGKPHFQAPGVACRGTRGYVAVRVDANDDLRGPFVYLKDAWRVDHPGIEREGSVLEALNAKDVPFVPTLVCHGDLAGPGQRTSSQRIWQEDKKNEGKSCPMKNHRHYRLVVAEVGRPLDQFDRGFTLVWAVLCCIVAHCMAFELVGIIHCDISAGNILLHKDSEGEWVGLLNDWELSKLAGGDQVARQPDHMGTWQFMSVNALNDPYKDITIPDEIESFFHVLLYLAVHFLPHNINPKETEQFIVDYFDGFSNNQEGYCCGRAKQEAMTTGRIALRTYNRDASVLTFYETKDQTAQPRTEPTPHPINLVFNTLLRWFRAHYWPDQPAEYQAIATAPMEKDRKKGRAFRKMLGRVNDEADADGSSSTGQVPCPAITLRAAPSTVARADAERLHTHRTVIEFLMDLFENVGWPQNDKVPDCKPSGTLVPRGNPAPVNPAYPGSASSTATKRSLDDPDVPASKRSRVGSAA